MERVSLKVLGRVGKSWGELERVRKWKNLCAVRLWLRLIWWRVNVPFVRSCLQYLHPSTKERHRSDMARNTWNKIKDILHWLFLFTVDVSHPKPQEGKPNLCNNVKGRRRRETKALSRPIHEKAEGCKMEAVTHGFHSITLGKIQNASFIRPPLILHVPESTADLVRIWGLK